jgi:sugar lactone lactonase YvrE
VLASPSDVVVLPDGRVLFAERGSNRIRAFATDGRLQTIAGELNSPTGLALHENVLYFTETTNHTVRAVDLGTGVISTIAGLGLPGFSGDGGPARQAKLDLPWAADVSADGRTLFFTEIGNHRVRTVNLTDGTITTFAGTGATAYNGNGLSAAETALQTPYGVSVAPPGFLYIADTGHHVVWRTPVRF